MKRVIPILVALMVLLTYFIGQFETADEDAVENEMSEPCDEYSLTDSLDQTAIHHRSWLEYTWNDNFCAAYQVAYGPTAEAEAFRNAMTVDDELGNIEFWREIYFNLYSDNKDKLTVLQDSLSRAGVARNLDRDAFARMVVAFVQDIPYRYVLSGDCSEKGDSPCEPNVRLGIFSPVEFVYSMKGDCDTRTVLLYTLLKNFGYSPIIVNSPEYRHSMLGLDLPASGEDFEYNGRRFAFWETTNVGWLPGMMPPEMNNKDYWFVALDYEYKDQSAGFH